ncbi:TonB-dependent receptor [Bernardetia sp. MNP-M8]|uniref:TonB-dependent receptor n=1 Tax=Bernardetia sp. MNP-M8 TaxID=3127470 RepID=UPI0030D02209
MKRIYLSSILIFLGLVFCATNLFAQTKLKGKVVDATTKNAISGAKIQKNGKVIFISNAEGEFSIDCEAQITLSVGFLGYQTSTINVEYCEEFLTVSLVVATENLNEVEVVSTINSDKELLEKPVSQVHLTTRELNRGLGLYLDDVINANVTGVTMQRRAVSSGQQFNIRGYGNGVGFRGASNNFDGQGYKVYLNNIPITDAEGVTLMDDIDFGSIGNVDVIKGPSGSLYGLAIAGVVNLKTIRPEKNKTSIGQSAMLGNYGLMRFTTTLQTATDKTSLLVNYGHQQSDGYMTHNSSKKDFMNLIFDTKLSQKQTITAYFGYSNSHDDRGGELSKEQYEAKDYSGNARYIKNNAHSDVVSFRTGISHKYDFKNWISNTTTIFGTGLTSNVSSAGGWTDKDPINYGLRSTFDFKFNLTQNVSLTGTAGIETQQQLAQIIGYSMVTNPKDSLGYNIIGGVRSNQYSNSRTSSIFTEWVLHLPSDISITAGIGSSNLKIDLENRLYNANSDKPTNVSANYDNMVSPRIAINKVFNNSVSVYASYSKGYKAPVSGNIVLSTSGELNTGLVPEFGNQFEIGSKGSILNGKLNYQVAIFETIFENKFTSVAVPLDANTTAYTYIANGGSQKNTGVEVLLKYNAYQSETGFLSGINPYMNVTYSDFKYDNFKYQSLANGEVAEVDFSGKAVVGVAPWVANAGVDFNTNLGFYGNVAYSYRDAMPFTSDGENVTDAYSLVNAKIGFRKTISKFSLDIYAGANNLGGTQYYYMVFLNQLPDAYLPAPKGTQSFGGISLKYNF